MSKTIGILLPRSTEYPAMGFDMLAGIKAGLAMADMPATRIVIENIGFGEDPKQNWSSAEKLLIQEQADIIICYSSLMNAGPLYGLARMTGKPFLFLDAGMQLMKETPPENCYHITLQGVHACSASGAKAGTGNRKVLLATSFYDGGYGGPWGYSESIVNAGGSICGNFVSTYRQDAFSINQYLNLLQHSEAEGVAACFSTYLAALFFDALKDAGAVATALPFYCSPFMAEEELLKKCSFPGGTFHSVVPWFSSLENEQQHVFSAAMNKEGKHPNLFALLGWEAAIVMHQIFHFGSGSLKNFHYQSPRGKVNFHPQTHHTYAPLYYGMIVAGEHGKCSWQFSDTIETDAATHLHYLLDRTDQISSGWKNNYFCI